MLQIMIKKPQLRRLSITLKRNPLDVNISNVTCSQDLNLYYQNNKLLCFMLKNGRFIIALSSVDFVVKLFFQCNFPISSFMLWLKEAISSLSGQLSKNSPGSGLSSVVFKIEAIIFKRQEIISMQSTSSVPQGLSYLPCYGDYTLSPTAYIRSFPIFQLLSKMACQTSCWEMLEKIGQR